MTNKMRKDRGLEELDSYLENFSGLIENKLKKTKKVKILDAGCGYGLAMAGLIKKFGDKIEIIGYNKNKQHGTEKILKEKSVKRGIFTEKEIKKIKNFPKIIYFDANKGIPFKNESFDLIYGLHSTYLYKDKIKFFEKINKILKKDGLARFTFFEVSMLKTKKDVFDNLKKSNRNHFIEIWNETRQLNILDYFNNFKGLKIKCGRRKDKDHAIIYLEIKKQPKLKFNLKLIDSVNMGLIAPDRYGVRDIYSLIK